MELAGLTPGTEYDQLIVTGNTSLDGTLSVVPVDISSYHLLDQLLLIDGGGTVSDTFDMIDGIYLGVVDGYKAAAAITYDPNAVYLTVALFGDSDLDGDVDGNDFLTWQSNFPMSSGATWADGDYDGDGDVDGNDFLTWQSNFPTSIPNLPGLVDASIAVPEPASLALLGLGSLLLLRRRRRV